LSKYRRKCHFDVKMTTNDASLLSECILGA